MAATVPAGPQAHVHSPNPLPSLNPFLRDEPPRPRPAGVDLRAPEAESVEVTVLWGTHVLSARQLTPPRSYAVGEIAGARGASLHPGKTVDFAMSSERLGKPRRELLAVRAGAPFAIFAADETPRVFERGQLVDATSAIVDCSDVAVGARGIELRKDRAVIIELCGISFRLAGSDKPERLPRAILPASERAALGTLGTAALLQGILVASLAYLTPSLAWSEEEDLDRDRLELMQQYLHASAAHEQEEQSRPTESGAGEKGAPAERHAGPEGAAGKPSATQAGRIAVAGKTAERALSRAELMDEAKDFGTIGLLNVLNASAAPTSPWGADLPTGPDAVNAMGDLFSERIGEGHGFGGVGLSGTGLGGGGIGVGVGLDRVGTCLGVNCYGGGNGGFVRSSALTAQGHVTTAPRIHGTTALVTGHLPPEVIQRVVRQNFGRFRQCYEIGLRTNPNLEGRVSVRFVIGRDGAVSNVAAGGDVPDAQVKSCVASAFYGLSFPTPEAGIVTVTYPIVLMPG